MQIGVLGISHQSAGIQMRELVSKAAQARLSSEREFYPFSFVVLSTCHRTEVYFSAINLAEAHSRILNELREFIVIPFEHKIYSYFGLDCFLHLAHVASGLDSIIIGESEIQRQVKVAYEKAQLESELPGSLHFLFQKCLKMGKEVRSKIIPIPGGISIEKVIFNTNRLLLKDWKSNPLFFIGNSEVNRRVMIYFKERGLNEISLCTRSEHSGREFSSKWGIRIFPWSAISCWKDFSLVVCGSNVSEYLIQNVQGSFRTQLIFDLGVPRNVDPMVGKHPKLTLLNMEEIGQMLGRQQSENLKEWGQAEQLILEKVQGYYARFQARLYHNSQEVCQCV